MERSSIRDSKAFIIFYILSTSLIIALVNLISKLIALVKGIVNKNVSRSIPLNILKRAIEECEKIDANAIHGDCKSHGHTKYDCVVLGGGGMFHHIMHALCHLSTSISGYKTVQYLGHFLFLLNHDLIDEHTKFIGSSLGSCCSVVAIVAYEVYKNTGKRIKNNEKLLELLSYLLVHTIEARLNIWTLVGTWWNAFQVSLTEILWNFDIDMNVFDDGKLEIVATKLFPVPSKQIFNTFGSKTELLDCLKASCMIPFWSNNYPSFYWKNNFYVDGGYSDLVPSPKANVNLVVYNDTVWWRTFVPMLHEEDYVQDIVTGYRRCAELARNK
eukprot:975946_1